MRQNMSSRIGPSPTETMTELICLRCPAIINGLLGNKKAILACNLTTWFDYLRGILEANALTDWLIQWFILILFTITLEGILCPSYSPPHSILLI